MQDLDFDRLVSPDLCRISRRVFSDARIYRWEQEYIFARSWLYLGHRSQLRKAGDFLSAWMGETPVILALGEEGRLHASINSCSHRGLPVCRADRGNARRFICPYHNWAYKVSGELVAIPQERMLQRRHDKSTLGLAQVPRLEEYEGLIFGSLDADAEPLEDYLGDMRFYLDTYFRRFPAGVEILEPVHKWLLPANWKLPVENQLGDVGHGPYLHGTLLAGNPALEEIDQYGVNVVTRPGHGAALRLMPEGLDDTRYMWGEYALAQPETPERQEILEYLREVQARTKEVLGELRARIKGLTYGVYPNLSFLWQNATLRVSHPRAPGQVEYWSWSVVPTDAPPSVRRFTREQLHRFVRPRRRTGAGRFRGLGGAVPRQQHRRPGGEAVLLRPWRRRGEHPPAIAGSGRLFLQRIIRARILSPLAPGTGTGSGSPEGLSLAAG